MSQHELAAKAGLSVRGLRKIETNQVTAPRPATVRLLADALGLSGVERDRFCATAHPATAHPATASHATATASHATASDANTSDANTGHTTAGHVIAGQVIAGHVIAGHAVTTGSAATRPAAVRPVPAQLPADIGGFTGRTDQLRWLADLFDNTDRAPTAVVITAIAGTAGVGKTALAVHWAHRIRHRFPDGQLYVNLRGFDPAGTVLDPAEAIRRFLDALDIPAARIPTDLDAQAALYRSTLANRRVLILLDNARDADQVRPLLPGAASCLVLVTSRNRLTPLVAAEGAQPLPIDLLTPAEARELIVQRLGHDRVVAEPGATDAIIDACARLPLALTIAAARAQQTGFPLANLAAELAETRTRLDTLDTGDPATEIRAVFSWSLTAVSAAAARLFRLLGLHPGPDITAPAAASLAGEPLAQVRRELAELSRANVLAEATPGRYSLHDLLRAYAADLTATTDPDAARHAATTRLLDHYVHTAHAADRLLHPTRDPIPLPLASPAAGTSPEQLISHDRAMAWLTVERPTVLAAMRHAADTGAHTHAWQLAWQLETFLNRQGHWHDRTEAWELALAAAGCLDDPIGQAYAHRFLAHTHTRLGRYDEAHVHLRRALTLNIDADDRLGQANAHYNLAMLWERQNQPLTALEHAKQAFDLYRDAGHRRGEALGLNAIGWCHCLVGNHAQAIEFCEQALSVARELGDRHFAAAVWDSLGYAHHHLGQHTVASACYQHSIGLYRECGNRFYVADVLTHLGDSRRAAGDVSAARDAWRQALAILADLDHPDADGVRHKLDALDAQPLLDGPSA